MRGEINMSKTMILQEAPNTEYLEFNFVGDSATGKGLNTQFVMENLHNGLFQVIDGRVGIKVGPNKPKKYTLSMEKWDMTYSMKISKGYILTKQEKKEEREIVVNVYDPIQDPDVASIVKELMDFANAVIEENYTTKVSDISEEMVIFASGILKDLSERKDTISVAEFNNKLKLLFAAIPRRIDNLSKILAKRKADYNDILVNEQELLDILNASRSTLHSAAHRTILDEKGLQWRTVTSEEEKEIKKMLGGNARQYYKAWAITNGKTQEAFDDFCRKEKLHGPNDISLLFHGSRSENWWSIVTNGLNVNPIGVVITGKMFGNGTYFAPKAKKSMGYTSGRNAYWTGGSQDVGFMAIYQVATGKRYIREHSEPDLNWNLLQQRCPGAHCTWAVAGASLLNDEVIVYQNQQSTIKYLIEFNA